MKVGVVSDTHGFFDPAWREHLAGVDCILHAGDVDSQRNRPHAGGRFVRCSAAR
jgi:predicted phosphodiesterase